MSTVGLGQKGVGKGCKSKAATVEDQAGLSQGSADGFERNAIRCRRVWLVAGAGVPLLMDQTLGDSETTRITRNEAQCWRGRQWTGN
jgi:hypothetical protein